MLKTIIAAVALFVVYFCCFFTIAKSLNDAGFNAKSREFWFCAAAFLIAVTAASLAYHFL